jgi:hypothetical protein
MATAEDMRIFVASTLTAGVTTLTHLETGLKILLLIVTIGYTLSRWYSIIEAKKDKNKNKNESNGS